MRGFSLVELLVSLAVLAMLATAATPMLQMTVKRDKEQQLRRALWQIRDAIDAYKLATEEGRISTSQEKSGYPSTLSDLTRGIENVKDPARRKIYFLRQIPRDPFATDPDLPNEKTWLRRSYAKSFTEGAFDEAEGEDVYDVRSRAQGVGLNGRPYSEW
jgi:general secretion pathway protein G